ncbi:MAG: hypothetical protein ACXADS_15545 [Candidatus Thorarchaeota archaeon]|jgi:hypothetical protein
MRFKEFVKLTEDGQGGGDKGLMGFGVPSEETWGNSPNKGQPFPNTQKSTAGARQSQGGGGMGAPGAAEPYALAAMKKKMKKKMKKP